MMIDSRLNKGLGRGKKVDIFAGNEAKVGGATLMSFSNGQALLV